MQSNTSGPSLRIGHVEPAERDTALRLAACQIAADRPEQLAVLISEAQAGEALILGAYRRDRLVGAVLAQIQPGRAAAIWPPQVTDKESRATAVRLLNSSTAALAGRGIRAVQCLLLGDDKSAATVLCEGGFRYLADLFYLVSTEASFPVSPPINALRFESYTADTHQRLLGIVDASYELTLDCPQLNGLRQTEDVLAGYRATGEFDPRRWLIVRHGAADVGCLLVADHPQHNTCELVYMGLVPAARGRGWGKDIARHAQWLTRQAGRERLALAVDAANGPALRMYEAVGFEAWDRRTVYLKVLPEPST
jgi:ribosomal protein S18 acetylase RimI-like enzyme